MKRLTVEQMPDIPADPRAYRCLACGVVVPWSQWSPAEREAWEWDGNVPNWCGRCERPVSLCENAGLVWDERDG